MNTKAALALVNRWNIIISWSSSLDTKLKNVSSHFKLELACEQSENQWEELIDYLGQQFRLLIEASEQGNRFG